MSNPEPGVCRTCGHQDDTDENGICQSLIGANNWEPCRCHCEFARPRMSLDSRINELARTICKRPWTSYHDDYAAIKAMLTDLCRPSAPPIDAGCPYGLETADRAVEPPAPAQPAERHEHVNDPPDLHSARQILIAARGLVAAEEFCARDAVYAIAPNGEADSASWKALCDAGLPINSDVVTLAEVLAVFDKAIGIPATNQPAETPGMRAAKRWFHDTRVEVERRVAGNSFADAALAPLEAAEQKLAAIIDSEIER